MKAAPFQYHDPTSIDEAIDLLGKLENAKVLAGGQSLMAMLNMRYAQPDHVVDINRIADLSYIREANGALVIGAMTRQRDLEFSDLVRRTCPILHEAIQHVGHRQTRNRGTVGGSLCHLDPSAELAAMAALHNATLTVAGPKGSRELAFKEFALGFMTPALEVDEILTAIRIEFWPKGHGYGFLEFARRHGDFAVASAGALITLDAKGLIDRASLVIGGVGSVPTRVESAEQILLGTQPTQAVFEEAARACKSIEALDDIHAPASYRLHLAETLARRALAKALLSLRSDGEQ
ncbi:MAG: xanthine dehydrogenase family protein subunit M [Telmatospirillum sp.]|nr:xanthine dehydrogenase family protein subunit M [Telmatospirillum sp.]MCZ8310310.1 xanthine dehydrogenase family protein subunit M [Magnetospirillum sp.]